MENILRSGFAALGVDVTDEALAALRRYYELLTERNRVMNLTAIEGEEAVARLHFLDSWGWKTSGACTGAPKR